MPLYYGRKPVNSVGVRIENNTSDATLKSGNQMLSGVTAYGANGKVMGTIPSKAATTIIPSESEQTAIPAGTYAAGDIKVAAVKAVNTVDLDAEIAEQDRLIEQLSTILDGKAGGTGGTVGYDTCTLNLVNDTGSQRYFTCTVVENNNITFYDGEVNGYGENSVSNVLCGCPLIIGIINYGTQSENVLIMDLSNRDIAYYNGKYIFTQIPSDAKDSTVYLYIANADEQ